MLDCVDVAFLPDGILVQVPVPSRMGATRLGGIDTNKHRTRTAPAGVLALAVSPAGITVAALAANVRSLTGQTEQDYTVRQAAYDLRKLRGKQLVVKPGRTRRYQLPGQAPAPSPLARAARSGHRAGRPRQPPASTATTRTSATACAPCSTSSAIKAAA